MPLVWGMALVTTILFFVSVILHELAHSLTARRLGLPVHTITLFVFGGVSELPREPEQASTEFWVSIAGPATSVVLGAIFLGLSRLGDQHQPLPALAWWLGSINLILAIFNLLPGFPLDGGRILRAILWLSSHDFMKATRWATRVGKGVAVLMIAAGIIEFFSGRGLGGLWIAFIGWFLLSAAEQSWRQTEIREALANYVVGDLSSPFYSRVSPSMSLEEYFERLSEAAHFGSSLVMDEEDHLLGMIAPADLRAVPRPSWSATPIEAAMTPRDRVHVTHPGDRLPQALEQMALENLSQLPVVDHTTVVGVLQRERIVNLLQSHLSAHTSS
jgi:Zn-dependent protease